MIMKYRINKYQVIYQNGARASVKPVSPICTDDYEAERVRLMKKHGGHGKQVLGINLEYEELK